MIFSRHVRTGALIALLLAPACGAPRMRGGAEGRHTDARSAAVMLLAGNATIGMAQVAAARAHDAAVRAFGARERTDHAAMNAGLADLLAQLDLEPVEDDRARAMRDAATAQRARLQQLTGRAFDIAFVDAELQAHRDLLVVLDELQRVVSRPEVREHVAALRPVVAAHVAHAEQLRGALAAPR